MGTSSTNTEQPENSAPAEQPQETSAPAESSSQPEPVSSEQSKYIYPIIDPDRGTIIYPDEVGYASYCERLKGDAGIVPTANSTSCYNAYWHAVRNGAGSNGQTVGYDYRNGIRIVFDIPGTTDAPIRNERKIIRKVAPCVGRESEKQTVS